MISKKIRRGLWYIGVWNEKIRGFGKVSYMDTGRMYSSYLMETDEGFIMFGALPERYVKEWLEEINRITSGEKIGWHVLFGTDDDRSAAKALLQEWPEAVLIGGSHTLYRLEGIVEAGFGKIEVRSHRSLTLGGRKLRFQVIADRFDTPSVYVTDREEGILFTADAFGSNYASAQATAGETADKEAYFAGVRQCYEDIGGSRRKKSLEAAAAMAREYDVSLICPRLGPAADYDLERLVSMFVPDKPARKEGLSLAMIYAPGGYIGELAKCIATGIRESGNITVEMYDLGMMSREEALEKASRCDACLFGTPEVGKDAAKAVWDIVTSLRREDCEGKPAAVFTSAGVRGGAAHNLRQRLAMLGCDLSLWDYQTQGRPDRGTFQNAYEYGFGVGCSVQKIPNLHKPTIVKCLVCGEIFDASLGICPVCGVGLEQCVPVEAEDVVFRNNTENKYVILGGGVAAVSAAEAIRRRDETGSIEMFSAENYLPINRPMLTKDPEAAAGSAENLLIHGQEWYDERKIGLHLGCPVTALDTENKTITTASGKLFPYDKLIYAMGAECFVPPFKGYDKDGVLTIRHLTDSAGLQERMKTARTAVVIGGGVLGLEAADQLMRRGISVTVLEAAPQIIGRQVDADTAAILKRRMEAMHVACHEGVSIAGMEGDGRVSGVRLEDGSVFPADFVIVSCGNRSNVELAKAAGIVMERAVLVNERMETSVRDVYACGDCAQFDGVNFQLWQEASDQGRVAGANAAGERITYANQALGLSLEGFGTSLFAIGDTGKRTDIPYRKVEIKDRVTNRYETYWFYGGILQGAVLVGAPAKTAGIIRAVTVHAEYDELFQEE